MTMHFVEIARHVTEDGEISSEEILVLRRAGWSSGSISPEEAEAIFAINDALGNGASTEWADFFVEALGEFVINGDEPRGYVGHPTSAWLMHQIDRDGAPGTMPEIELLVRVLERAQNSPAPFKAYVLAKIEQAVTTGTGPTRTGGALAPGHVTAAEAALLRRVLFAPSGEGPASVGKGEAELLFRLKDASLNAPNDPEWKRLFVQGIGNYLMGRPSATAHPGRDRIAELEAFASNTRASVGGFLAQMTSALPGGGGGDAFGKKTPGRDRFAELRQGEEITGSEQAWLDTRIGADGQVDEYEQALLDFLAGGDI